MPFFVEISSLSHSFIKKLHKKTSCSKHPKLLEYLTKYAYRHSRDGLFKTYLLNWDKNYLGYVSISIATIESNESSFSQIKDIANIQRGLQYSIPAIKITRLCVFDEYQNKGIGRILMEFAGILSIVLQAKSGCKVQIVDAKKDAVDFYINVGFEQINCENDTDTILMIKKVITPYELNSYDINIKKEYLHNIEEFCKIFNLDEELSIIQNYYF